MNKESEARCIQEVPAQQSFTDGQQLNCDFHTYCYGNSEETEKSLLDMRDGRTLERGQQSFSLGDEAQVYTWEYLIQCASAMKPKTVFSLTNSSGRKKSCPDKKKGGAVMS